MFSKKQRASSSPLLKNFLIIIDHILKLKFVALCYLYESTRLIPEVHMQSKIIASQLQNSKASCFALCVVFLLIDLIVLNHDTESYILSLFQQLLLIMGMLYGNCCTGLD